MSAVRERMTALLIEKFNFPAEEVQFDVSFDSLDMDSLALAELAIILGKELGVEITDEEMSKEFTPEQSAKLIEAKVSAVALAAR